MMRIRRMGDRVGLSGWAAVLGLAMGCGGTARDEDPFANGPESIGDDGEESTTGGDEMEGDELKLDTPDNDPGPGDGLPGGDPVTCEQAKEFKTYIGCDFWPTVTANAVWPIFDFAVVVANAGDEPAEVTVDRGGMPIGGSTTIPPNELRTIYLPWVEELKGPSVSACGSVETSLTSTVRAPQGAYHLESSRPVTVYQFSALQYAAQGGPPGKDWSSCPAHSCTSSSIECFSYSNDASLLLPSTALTNNYRVTGYRGWQAADVGPTVAVTGTEDATNVTVTVSSQGVIRGGPGVAETNAGGVVSFNLDRGEVVELVGTPTADLSGSLIQSDKPVQVIFSMSCTQVPYGTSACDHIEESVFPAETFGSHYFVTVPTSPNGQPVAHLVRIYGNVDGTALSYPSGKPNGMPDVINAGQVVEVGRAELEIDPFANPPFWWDLSVTEDFEIVGDHEFAVATFQFGAQALGTDTVASELGDPSQSLVTAAEQYRTKYVFLAPLDYPVSFVDVVQPMGATVEIDGAPAGGTLTEIGNSGFGVRRVPLGAGNDGAHVLISDEPVGIQVMGYGNYTSYQYPGGLNLDVIAPPPPPPA
jgi:hypothetical protein